MLSYIYVCIHVEYPLFWSEVNQTWIFSTHFNENPSNGSRSVPRGTDRRRDMTKLVVAFHNFVKKRLIKLRA
jgi:hypothetical protein